MVILGFIGAMIPIFTVIIKLNSTITKLNTTIEILTKQMETSQEDRSKMHDQLNDHETRISILENKE
jgi:septal ring factor EnvC (AmiA/AmiB activator)